MEIIFGIFFMKKERKKIWNYFEKIENNEEDENNDIPFIGGMKASKDIDFDDFNEDEFDQKENSFEEKE